MCSLPFSIHFTHSPTFYIYNDLPFYLHLTVEILVVSKDDTLVAKIKNTPFHSNTNWNGSSMTIGIEDLGPIDGIDDEKHNLKIKSRKYFN